MAIYNDIYPVDMYDKNIPESVKQLAPSVCIVAAVGQKFVQKDGASLSPKTSGYYYNTIDPRYPNGGDGKLDPAIGDETAVWMTGTCFAISSQKFITAKHVVEDVLAEVDSKDFKDLRIISGYYRKSSPSSSFTYTTLKVASVQLYANCDLAVIITANALPSSVPTLSLATQAEQRSVGEGAEICMLGNPLGQPQKYSTGTVSETDNQLTSFKGWISSFPGNSGSPVIDVKTGKVVGIMVSGSPQSDWAYNASTSCYGYAKFPNNDDHFVEFLYSDNLGIVR